MGGVFKSLEADRQGGARQWWGGGKNTGKACLHRLKELPYFRSIFEGEFEV